MRDQFVPTKAAVTVSEMARMAGLSRSRFYQLVEAGAFPQPVYCVSTRRPMYEEELQKSCLEVRRRNCGVNGRPILFYACGYRPSTPAAKPVAPQAETGRHQQQRDHRRVGRPRAGRPTRPGGEAVAALYPSGVNGNDGGVVLRAVFLRLKASGSGK